MNRIVYALALAIAVGGPASAQTPCGRTANEEESAKQFASLLIEPMYSSFREEAPTLETLPATTPATVVAEPRECARLQRPIRAAIREIYPDGQMGLDGFSFTIFRVGPYYLVYLGVHKDVNARYSVTHSLQPLLFIRATDLEYVRHTMIN